MPAQVTELFRILSMLAVGYGVFLCASAANDFLKSQNRGAPSDGGELSKFLRGMFWIVLGISGFITGLQGLFS